MATDSLNTHPVIDTTIDVTTPEKIAFEYQVVGPFRRLISYLIDVAASIMLYGILAFLGVMLYGFALEPIARSLGLTAVLELLGGLFSGMLLVGLFLIYWFYGAFMETYYNGQTVGKMMMRYRVLSVDGHAIDGVQAALRNFFRLLDLMPVAPLPFIAELNDLEQSPALFPTCIFGLLVMMISPRYQRIGDLVARTMVVLEEKKWVPEMPTFGDVRVAMLAAEIPGNFPVSRSMARALADYVDHRPRLHPLRAAEIAKHLAIPLLARLPVPADTNHDLLLCALYYRTFMDMSQTDDDDLMPVRQPAGPATVGGSGVVAGPAVAENDSGSQTPVAIAMAVEAGE